MNTTSDHYIVSIVSEASLVSIAASDQKIRPSEGIIFNLSFLGTKATKED